MSPFMLILLNKKATAFRNPSSPVCNSISFCQVCWRTLVNNQRHEDQGTPQARQRETLLGEQAGLKITAPGLNTAQSII